MRVLEVARFLEPDMPPDELRDLETMVGEVFSVYEIDESGAAWVEKVWITGDRQSHSHSIGLRSHEIEVVKV